MLSEQTYYRPLKYFYKKVTIDGIVRAKLARVRISRSSYEEQLIKDKWNARKQFRLKRDLKDATRSQTVNPRPKKVM